MILACCKYIRSTVRRSEKLRRPRSDIGAKARPSADNKIVVIQCMVEKNLQDFNFDGRNLKPAGQLPLSGGGAGLRTAAR